MMRIMYAVLALSVSACDLYLGDNHAPVAVDAPPAASPPPDVAVDAPPADPRPHPGCAYMGNLPSSRTETFTPDSPVLSDVLNEIQDNIIAHNRVPWIRRFTPQLIFGSGGGFVGVVNPAGANKPHVLGNSSTSVSYFAIPFEQDDEFVGFVLDVFGNGNNLGADVLHYASVTSDNTSLGSQIIIAAAASWQQINIQAPDFTPVFLNTAANMLRFRVSVVSGGACIGDAFAIFQRLP